MSDPRINNLAKILVQHSTKIKPGDLVAVLSQPAGEPLVYEVFRQVLKAGGHPYLIPAGTMYLPGYQGLEALFMAEASQAQLQHEDVIAKKIVSDFDAAIFINSADNTRELSGIEPSRVQARYRALSEVYGLHRQRTADKSYAWVVTTFPTNAYAQDADMSLADYQDFVYAATFADKDDPLGEWQAVHDYQQQLVEWLRGKRRVALKGPHIDLELSIEGRGFINSDGTHNMPSGEVYTSPVEDSANGWVYFTYPAVFRGRECEGVKFHFENGRVVEATAKKGQAYLNTILDTDDGSRFMGEFAFGTNNGIQRFTKSILFDEKIGGSVHMAVGYGFPEAGSTNQSAVHWDFICDMRDGGQAYVDGQLFYDSGQFKL
jgi:aminopeptidase